METSLINDFYPQFLASSGICIDSRKMRSNQIFVAFKGENVDGHAYVSDVLDKFNDAFAIIEDEAFARKGRTMTVESALKFLQNLARHHRNHFKGKVLGLTGSNGKTTTKELLFQALKTELTVHATKGNYNNHLGVPLTLLDADVNQDFYIIEMGANFVGDIAQLCQIADPDMGLITNIGLAHIEGFGSEEGILQGKSELYKYVAQKSGTIFYNKTSEKLKSVLPSTTHNISYPLEDISIDAQNFYLKIKDLDSHATYQTQLYGAYNGMNIQASLCVGQHLGISKEKMLSAIVSYKSEINRSQVIEHTDVNTKVILDAYNANPSSMRAGILNLINQEPTKEKVLILGDMKELGIDELNYHAEIISCIDQYKFKYVFLVGTLFDQVNSQYITFENVDMLNDYLKSNPIKLKNTIILAKGSRSMTLEKSIPIIESILN